MISVIAQTGNEFAEFAPYVPAINDAGEIAFQCELTSGGSAIVLRKSTGGIRFLRAGELGCNEFVSHPDLNSHGDLCVFGVIGPDVVLMSCPANEPAHLVRGVVAGPLGPVINENGDIAFRGSDTDGAGVFLFRNQSLHNIASVRDGYSEFHGLPIVTTSGSVVFRADCADQHLLRWTSGETEVIVSTTEVRTELNRFPSLTSSELVGYVETICEGSQIAKVGNVEIAKGHLIETLIRGVLCYGEASAYVIQTPKNTGMGVYHGDHRLIGIGDQIGNEKIVDFALNSVSVNSSGSFVLRALFDSGVGAILLVTA